MRIFISIILFSLFMTACTNYKDKTQDNHINESSKRNICKIDSTFKLDYFKTMPKKFGFQGDYYTYDTTKISNDKYIFISDLTDIAVMKINGKDIYLKSDTLNDKPRINDLFQESWKGNGYEVLLKDGFDPALITRVISLVDSAEYKRRQYPPGTKISARAFGKDRRLPMTSHWRES